MSPWTKVRLLGLFVNLPLHADPDLLPIPEIIEGILVDVVKTDYRQLVVADFGIGGRIEGASRLSRPDPVAL